MAIPKKTNSAAQQLRATRPSEGNAAGQSARTIFANDKATRDKLTLTMEVELKRQLKAAAAMEGLTISELVDRWARTWLYEKKR